MSNNQSYANLKATFARVRNINYAAEILAKDMETVMARGSTQDRINQIVAMGDHPSGEHDRQRHADGEQEQAEQRHAADGRQPGEHDRRRQLQAW